MYVVDFSSIMTAISLRGWSITALRLGEIFGSHGKREKERERKKKKKRKNWEQGENGKEERK